MKLTPEQKEHELNRLYWKMLLIVAAICGLVALLAKAYGPRLKSDPLADAIVLLIPTALGIAGSQWHRRALRKRGISYQEMMFHFRRQIVSKAMMMVILIFVVLKLFGLIKL